jgi:hypothetical protein
MESFAYVIWLIQTNTPIALLMIGQSLNLLVWHRIGLEGVCYGNKFHRTVPWCFQFPFTIMSDTQYWGAVLTIWGVFLFASEADPVSWFWIPCVETMLYMISMKIEY